MAGAGALRNVDRCRLVAQALLSRAMALPHAVRAGLGLGERAMACIDISSIRMPDTAAARRAGELLEASSPPWLANHCMRTWLWGAMLAQAGGIRYDEELFFTASVLHDLGLTGHQCGAECACFAVQGARAAEQFAQGMGWPAERRERLSEAISLHMNVRVSLHHGAEAHLLHEGAAMDVIGARVHEICLQSQHAVLARYPRLGLKRHMAAVMKHQGQTQPGSRAAFLTRLGFIDMIRGAAWQD